MPNLRKIKPEEIKLNTCYSAPVFFDDGKNMFLAPRKLVKQYHINSLKRWEIPFLMTAGQELDADKALNSSNSGNFMDSGDYEEVVELEEFV